jgi:hypothetical protein
MPKMKMNIDNIDDAFFVFFQRMIMISLTETAEIRDLYWSYQKLFLFFAGYC